MKKLNVIIVYNKNEDKILMCKREKEPYKGKLNLVGGKVEANESELEAAYRELKEEIGTNDVEIIAQYPQWLSYDFPENVAKKMRFDGQSQKYFLVRLKPGAKIDINTPKPEFNDFSFVKVEEINKIVNSFKKPVYTKVIKYFKEKGYI